MISKLNFFILSQRTGEFGQILNWQRFDACSVPRIQGIVYCTWSTTSDENEALVAACVDEVNASLHTKTPYNHGPSVLPLSVADIEAESAPLIGKAMRFQPSSCSCGCFTATVTREVNVIMCMFISRLESQPQ